MIETGRRRLLGGRSKKVISGKITSNRLSKHNPVSNREIPKGMMNECVEHQANIVFTFELYALGQSKET